MNEPSAWDTSGRRVFLLATASVAAHQIQSWIVEPEEGTFRAAYLALTGLAAFSALLPRRPRGAIAIVVGLAPLGGALGAHLLPILRGRPVPSASETAILNLGGAAFLVALGVSLLGRPRGEEGQEHNRSAEAASTVAYKSTKLVGHQAREGGELEGRQPLPEGSRRGWRA